MNFDIHVYTNCTWDREKEVETMRGKFMSFRKGFAKSNKKSTKIRNAKKQPRRANACANIVVVGTSR